MSLGTLALPIGALVLVAGVGAVLFSFARLSAGAGGLQQRVRTYAALPNLTLAGDRRRSRISRLRIRLNAMLSSLNSERLGLQLLRANWRMTVTEFVLIRLALAAGSLSLGWLITRSPLSGLGLAMMAYLVPGMLLRRKVGRRQIEFEKQLIDVLVLITGSVRAGFSLLQAIEVVVREMKPPASEEFRRVLRETGLGVALPKALRNLAARMENGDVDLVVTAVEIQYQVGGNLATMLTAVTGTIRERVRLLGEVRVLTTQQRYTAHLLSVLPFFVGSMLFVLNPQYMGRLFEPGPMLCIPVGALIGLVLGQFAIRRIARIEV
jgi:tight adherence protein B